MRGSCILDHRHQWETRTTVDGYLVFFFPFSHHSSTPWILAFKENMEAANVFFYSDLTMPSNQVHPSHVDTPWFKYGWSKVQQEMWLGLSHRVWVPRVNQVWCFFWTILFLLFNNSSHVQIIHICLQLSVPDKANVNYYTLVSVRGLEQILEAPYPATLISIWLGKRSEVPFQVLLRLRGIELRPEVPY